jgi:hypothetical protein
MRIDHDQSALRSIRVFSCHNGCHDEDHRSDPRKKNHVPESSSPAARVDVMKTWPLSLQCSRAPAALFHIIIWVCSRSELLLQRFCRILCHLATNTNVFRSLAGLDH